MVLFPNLKKSIRYCNTIYFAKSSCLAEYVVLRYFALINHAHRKYLRLLTSFHNREINYMWCFLCGNDTSIGRSMRGIRQSGLFVLFIHKLNTPSFLPLFSLLIGTRIHDAERRFQEMTSTKLRKAISS